MKIIANFENGCLKFYISENDREGFLSLFNSLRVGKEEMEFLVLGMQDPMDADILIGWRPK